MLWPSPGEGKGFSSPRPRCGTSPRYFVRASEQVWDYAPSGMDLMDNVPLDGHGDGDIFLVNRPEDLQIGSKSAASSAARAHLWR